MTTQSYSVNFLEPISKKRVFKLINVVSMLMLVLNMSMISVFLVPSASIASEPTNIPLKKLEVKTCTGEGELYLYQNDPFQPIATSFNVERSQVLIFARGEALLSAKVNGNPANLITEADVASPFKVKVYSLATQPGDTVSIDGTHKWNARGVQGYLAQDASSPVYDISSLEVVYDNHKENAMHLVPDTYSYIFFDKYTENIPGQGIDTRELVVEVADSSVLHSQTYTQPAPSPAEGAVVGSYTVSTAGDYTMSVATEDSMYWMYSTCEAPACGDGVQNEAEECDAGAQNGLVCEAAYGQTCTYCDAACKIIEQSGPYCGDNIKNGAEECDNQDGVGENQVCADDCSLVDLGECGDGVLDSNEECDEGELNNLICQAPYGGICTYCTSECKNQEISGPFCGDGLKNGDEECDALDGVGEFEACNEKCQIVSTASCGDGIEQSGEDCDAGAQNGLVCEAAYGQTCTYCSNVCTDITISGPFCGDQVKNGDEECDALDAVGDNQKCTSECRLEDLPYCGDNIKQDNEECDDGNLVDGDGCSASCTKETTPPSDPVCGDGVKAGSEECDDGADNGLVCEAAYGQTCTYCSNVCTDITISGPFCGDGVKNGDEECDTNDGVGDNQSCSGECALEDNPLNSSCGDGVLDAGEACDAGELNGLACEAGYGQECSYCSNICTLVDVQGPYCGDGIKQDVEQCDDHNTVDGDGCNSACTKENSGGGGGRYYRYTNQGQTEPVVEEEPVVLAEIGEPVLTIEKTVNADFANPGEKAIEYSIVVSNIGNLDAYMVTLSDVLPDGLAYADLEGNTRSWGLGDIAPGESATTTYLVNVDESAQNFVYVNTADVKALNHESVTDTAELEVRIVAVLAETGFSVAESLSLVISALMLLGATKGLKKTLVA